MLVNEAIRAELLALKNEDLRVRRELADAGLLGDGYHPLMEEVHRRNAGRLKEIVAVFGWPVRNLAGADGSAAAWLILQHAIGDPAWQRAMLPELWRLAEAGEIERADAAFLEDRVRFFEGRPQIYGTQGWPGAPDGRTVRWQTEEPGRVNERRGQAGLDPIDLAQVDGEPMTPEVLEKWHAGFEEWLRRSGWR